MGFSTGLKLAENLACSKIKSKYIAPVIKTVVPEEIGLQMGKLSGDTVVVSKKSLLGDFFAYLKGYAEKGENFVPYSENPESLFMQYFNYRKSVCVPVPEKKFGSITRRATPAPPKIIYNGDNCNDYVRSLKGFINYVWSNPNTTKSQFYALIDEISALMPNYVRKKYPMIRPEIAEKADKIFKWKYILAQETKGNKKGELVYSRFFDKEMKENAIKEYKNFVETITGKKVLIGSPTRMDFAVDTVTLYNNPNSYKNIDYILWGHGTGSSLADIKDPNTWRFTDTGESIWKFMGKYKGKKFLVTSCEEDAEYWKARGRIPQDYSGTTVSISERKMFPELKDKNGTFMPNVGSSVYSSFGETSGAKICVGGNQQILGNVKISGNYTDIEDFVSAGVGDFEQVYYNL